MMDASAQVLYIDWTGHPSPLTECFHATASRRLSSSVDRHPLSTLTEPDSAYCPTCLTPQDKAALGRFPFCPKTTCQRCPMCNGPALVNAVQSREQQQQQTGLCVYKCSACAWTSQECGLWVPVHMEEVTDDGSVVIDRLELARSAEDLLLDLKTERQRHTKPLEIYFERLKDRLDLDGPRNSLRKTVPARIEPWSLRLLEKDLETTKNQLHGTALDSSTSEMQVRRLSLSSGGTPTELQEDMSKALPSFCYNLQSIHFAQEPVGKADLLPLATPLRVRLSRRCRAELAEKKPGILIKPKPDPLDGDSSQRTGMSQWMKKDCSAIHVIPRVRVVRCVDFEGCLSVLLRVNNPNIGSLRFRFTASDYQGERAWGDGDQQQCNTSMRSLLVDSKERTTMNVDLDVNFLKDILPSATVELLSSEDSIIELGTKGSEIPTQVEQWRSAPVTEDKKIEFLGQSASVAWFVLSLPMLPAMQSTSIALPLALEIELGNGSWETSLITPHMDLAEVEGDKVRLDLLVVLSPTAR